LIIPQGFLGLAFYYSNISLVMEKAVSIAALEGIFGRKVKSKDTNIIPHAICNLAEGIIKTDFRKKFKSNTASVP